MTSILWNPLSAEEFEAGPCAACSSAAWHCRDGAFGIMNGDDGFYTPYECEHGIRLMPSTPSGRVASAEGQEDLVALVAAAEAYMLQSLRGCAEEDLTFGEIAYLGDLEYFSAETPANRRARLAAMKAKEAAEDHGIILSKVKRKEEKWTNKGKMEFRICAPCRYATWLLERKCAGCSAQVPEGQTACSALIVKVEEMERRHDGREVGTGKMISRQVRKGAAGARVCGEVLAGCWNHEQHGTCIYVHPEERQWADASARRMPRKVTAQEFEEWGMVPTVAAPVNRFAAMGGHGQRQPQEPAQPAARRGTGRWGGGGQQSGRQQGGAAAW